MHVRRAIWRDGFALRETVFEGELNCFFGRRAPRLLRREEPMPSAGTHPARASACPEAATHHDARLHAPRHDHPVRGARCAHRQAHHAHGNEPPMSSGCASSSRSTAKHRSAVVWTAAWMSMLPEGTASAGALSIFSLTPGVGSTGGEPVRNAGKAREERPRTAAKVMDAIFVMSVSPSVWLATRKKDHDTRCRTLHSFDNGLQVIGVHSQRAMRTVGKVSAGLLSIGAQS